MRNKIFIFIIGILFIISLLFTVIGLLLSRVEKEEIAPDYPNNIQRIAYNNDQKEIAFISKIENFDFYHANKSFESSYINGSIDNNNINIYVSKDGINNSLEDITYTVKDVMFPQASKAQISSDEGNLVRVYSLDKYGRLLLSEFNADPNSYNNITTYLIDVKDVVSFAVLNITLADNDTSDQIYAIFKTKDGTYYTDYLFEEGTDHKITKLINISVN